MLSVHIEKVGDMAVVECEGRIIRSEAAFMLRNAVTSQTEARIVVLDFSELDAIGGGGLGMLMFLQRWARDHEIRLKLFNPRQSVRDQLERVSSVRDFDVASREEMMALLSRAGGRYERVA